MSFVHVVPPKVSSPLVGVTPHPWVFVMPDVVSHCAFDLHIHEELPRVVRESKAWMINGSNIARSEKALISLRGLKAGGLPIDLYSPYARWSDLAVSVELGCACFPLAPLRKLRTCCDFLNWVLHLDDLSDDMDDRGTDMIGNEVITTYRQPNAYDPKSHVGKLAKRFISLAIAEA